MDPFVVDAQTWAKTQFGTADLHDKRRTERLVYLATQITAHPSGSFPEQRPGPGMICGRRTISSTVRRSPFKRSPLLIGSLPSRRRVSFSWSSQTRPKSITAPAERSLAFRPLARVPGRVSICTRV
jgi:Transposase DNA-binding